MYIISFIKSQKFLEVKFLLTFIFILTDIPNKLCVGTQIQ